MKRMLFNATQSEELRVAIVSDSKLEDLDFERGNREQRKSNIYKAVVTRVEPSLEAAFVNYGVDRHGFLPFKEIAPEYYSKKSRKKDLSIKDVINEGQEIIVQVSKDERGNKGAALTSYLSLAGRYIVLMPNNNDGGGISRRIEGEERSAFKEVLSQLTVTKGTSVIGRTAGIGASVEQIQWDLDYLNQLWEAIENAANAQEGSFLIYQESNLVIRAIRDYFSADIEEVLIDKQEIFDQAHQFMSHVMPDYAERVKLYEENISLFSKFNIENQIESAFLREVQLPSGGSIVIDHTEALVSVDVNSSRSTKGRDIENTAFNTNLEAASELAKQMRLRDIGGLVVVDFIDMEHQKNQREVENRMRDALKNDKARIQLGKISRFGLMELSRQRLRPSLGDSINGVCPKCSGTGRVRDIQSTALYMLRLIQDEAAKDENQIVSIQLPVEVATLLLNEKRAAINELEEKTHNDIVIIPNRYFEIPKYLIERTSKKSGKISYTVVEPPVEELANGDEDVEKDKLTPVVKSVMPANSSTKKNKQTKSLLGFFKNLIGSDDSDANHDDRAQVEITSPETVKGNGDQLESVNENRANSNSNRRPGRNRNRKPGFNKNQQQRRERGGEDATPQPSVINSKEVAEENIVSIKTPNQRRDKPVERIIEKQQEIVSQVKEKQSDELLSTKPDPKKKPVRKRVAPPKVDLEKVGLKLVETSKTAVKEIVKEEATKPKPRKKAAWQQTEVVVKSSEKLQMVETKKKPAAKPKKSAKKD
jgi:ribonuclease E